MQGCERTVMVVEDDPYIRDSVAEVLKDDGFEVKTACHGREALAMLYAARPHPCVVLVDLMLPVMTGWELVTEMRNDPSLSDIPVVVTSAAADRAPPNVDKVLAKPLRLDTLLATVSGFCEQRTNPDPKNEALRDLARKNVELAELRRFRDEMVALIVHDLKNPLAIVGANVEYAARSAADPEAREALRDAMTGVARVQRIVDNLLDLTRMETGVFLPRRSRVSLATLLSPIVAQRRIPARNVRVSLEARVPADLAADLDGDLLARAVENTLDNALRHTPRFGQIVLDARTDGGFLRISVGNSGEPIPVEARERVFEKYGQAGTTAGRTNLGLGLYFCRLVAESHGGRIVLEERPELPVVFTFELPA